MPFVYSSQDEMQPKSRDGHPNLQDDHKSPKNHNDEESLMLGQEITFGSRAIMKSFVPPKDSDIKIELDATKIAADLLSKHRGNF